MRDDPYAILGLPPQADEASVKTAFRALAKECHPDLHAGADASERFRRLKTAYDTLMDPAVRAEARRRHDEAGPGSTRVADEFRDFFDDLAENGRGREIRSGKRVRGSDIARQLSIDLLQAFTGLRAKLRGVAGPCPDCAETGRVATTERTVCPGCNGHGRSRRVSGFTTVEVACPLCSGAGTGFLTVCGACGGTGQTPSVDASVDIPKGCRDGYRVTLKGRGAPGLNGASAGDLIVTVRIRPDVRFRRIDDRLVVDATIPVWDAALGTNLTVEGLDGKPLSVLVPPGTSHGACFSFKGQGMPSFSGRGDLDVVVHISVPVASEGHAREAFERLRDSMAPGGTLGEAR